MYAKLHIHTRVYICNNMVTRITYINTYAHIYTRILSISMFNLDVCVYTNMCTCSYM